MYVVNSCVCICVHLPWAEIAKVLYDSSIILHEVISFTYSTYVYVRNDVRTYICMYIYLVHKRYYGIVKYK